MSNLKIAIMQPYFFPYIGYFQLMQAVDQFILHDNLQYTKKGWINRNRVLVDGRAVGITLPIRAAPHTALISEIVLADSWPVERSKLLNRLGEYYRKAPFFEQVYPLIRRCLECTHSSLFEFIRNSLVLVRDFLAIATPLINSSTLEIEPELKGEQRVLAICKACQATAYVNPIGGRALYSKDVFSSHGIQLSFLQTAAFEYRQLGASFVPFLSIIDVAMFNDRNTIKDYLGSQFTLI